MAKKMTESKAKKLSGRASARSRSSAPKCAPRSANKNQPDKPVFKSEPDAALESVQRKTESGLGKSQLPVSSTVKEFVGDHFDEILQGLLKSVQNGNASSGKLLLDYSRLAEANESEKALSEAELLNLADVFQGHVDWKQLLNSSECESVENENNPVGEKSPRAVSGKHETE
jgi:hypothetical protein